jgi:hypothetical protein
MKSEDSPLVKVVKTMVQQIMKKSSATTPNCLIDSGMMAEDFAREYYCFREHPKQL